MTNKKSRKIISILLAIVMVFSATTATITASAAYKPTYGEKATEEDFVYLLNDLLTLADENIFTGDSIEAIYKVLPSLSAIVNNGSPNDSTKAAKFYTDPFFAELGNYTEDGTIVDDTTTEDGTFVPGTFSKFFEDHPIVCENETEFKDELKKIIDIVIMPNVMQTLVMLPLFGMGEQAIAFANGIDDVCAALGIEQESDAATLLGFITYQGDEKGTEQYLYNIVEAVFANGDSVNNTLNLIRTALNDENFAQLYKGLKAIFGNLNAILTTLSSSLGIDLGNTTQTIDKINEVLNGLPTMTKGELVLIDINAAIPWLLEYLGYGTVTGLIEIPEIDLSKVTGTETNTDLVKTVFDYVYNLLMANKNTIELAITDNGDGSLLENILKTEIPAEVEEAVLSMLKMSNDELADYAITEVAHLAGREIVEEPTTEEPTTGEPTTEEPTTEEPTTQKPAQESTTASNQKTPVNNSNPKIPNTGVTENYVAGVSTIIAVFSAVALAYVLIVSKKKITDK